MLGKKSKIRVKIIIKWYKNAFREVQNQKFSPPWEGDTLDPIPPHPWSLWASAADPPGKKYLFMYQYQDFSGIKN